MYVYQCFLRVRELKPPNCSRIGGSQAYDKTRDNNGDLMSPVSHDAVVRPRSALRQSWHKSIGRWPGSESAITIGKMEWR